MTWKKFVLDNKICPPQYVAILRGRNQNCVRVWFPSLFHCFDVWFKTLTPQNEGNEWVSFENWCPFIFFAANCEIIKRLLYILPRSDSTRCRGFFLKISDAKSPHLLLILIASFLIEYRKPSPKDALLRVL